MQWDASLVEVRGAQALPPGEVHVWAYDLEVEAKVEAAAFELLSSEEKGRAERFRFPRDRRRFTVARATLRRLLGEYHEVEPAKLIFRYGPNGKPYLPDMSRDIRFNVSHSEELAVYALALGREVGVDVEFAREMDDAASLVERFFSQREQAYFKSLPASEQHDAFFRCWVRKEAFIKAVGEGLFRSLHDFSVSFDKAGPALLLELKHAPDELDHWKMHEIMVASGFMGALVVAGEGSLIRRFRRV
jgi:4'-phosphopantetheinyl transferase